MYVLCCYILLVDPFLALCRCNTGYAERASAGRGGQGSRVGLRRRVANRVDDSYFWILDATVAVSLGAQEKFLPRNVAAHRKSILAIKRRERYSGASSRLEHG